MKTIRMGLAAAARRLGLAIVALTVCGVTSALATDTLRVTLSTLPPQQGHPFATSATPTITTTGVIFDGLTRIDAEGRLQPWLAVSWENIDRQTWRFHLRPGVTFSNGAPLNAAAVVFTVDYLTNHAIPGRDNLARDLPPFESARVVDELTVDIVTRQPVPIFPRYASALLIVEPGAYQSMSREAFQRAPVGTGPFAVERWEDSRVTFRAHDQSWRRPLADRMELIELPETTSRVQAIISNQADVAIGLMADDMMALSAAGQQGISWRDAQVSSITFVTTRDLPFNDVRVRQALNMAVNRQPIIDVLLHGATVPANQPAAQSVRGYNPDIPQYPYDPDRAKALLAEAGYPNGFSFVFEATPARGELSAYQQVAADLAQVGVKMEIRILPGPQYLKNLFQTGEYADAVAVPWLATPTQDVLRPMEIHSCNSRFAWYCDQDVMPLLEAAMTEWDEEKALALRHELGRLYHDRAPSLFLYEVAMFAGLRAGVTGFEDAGGFISYDTIDVSQRK